MCEALRITETPTATRRLKGDESEAIKRIMIAVSVLSSGKETLWERLKLIKNGRRDYAMSAKKIEALFGDLLDTVPTEQLLTMRRNLASLGYTIGVRRPGASNDRDYGAWLSWEALNALFEAAREKCIVCDLPNDKQRQCPLAKVLDGFPSGKSETAKGCGYFGLL